MRHEDIWRALDTLAAETGLSASGLAKRAGLDPTTFNPSKRRSTDGRNRWPSTESLAKDLGATGASLESFTALSLDAELPGSEDGYSLSDALGSPDPALDTVVDRESVKPRLAALPERERAILYMRFFGDMTQSRIAEHLGISQMHVSRLISRCCARMRDQIMREAA